MTISEFQRKSAEKTLHEYCQNHRPFPLGLRTGFLLFELKGACATLYAACSEHFEFCPTKTPIAQLRFNDELNQWTLHYRGQKDQWQFYLNAAPSLDLNRMLRVLDEDPLGLFWR